MKQRSSKERGGVPCSRTVKQKHWMIGHEKRETRNAVKLTGFRASSMKSWGTRCLLDTEKSSKMSLQLGVWNSRRGVEPRLPR